MADERSFICPLQFFFLKNVCRILLVSIFEQERLLEILKYTSHIFVNGIIIRICIRLKSTCNIYSALQGCSVITDIR